MAELKLRTVDEVKCDALAAGIYTLLRECTVEQQAFFNQLVPGHLEAKTESDLVRIYSLVLRTVQKNRKEKN